ncbi:hypothetical protein DL93DRAFT_2080172 [Clavulina sp. PMI_390]|nr:hypothetical protein DL93DRAFT_2080172 [Clavulina sp. PMI_390]
MTSNPSSDTQAQNELLQALGPRDPQSFPFASLPEPTSADAKCKVALIRTGRGTFPKFLFVDGPVPRGPTFVGPSFSFLIEKEKNGQVERVLFELGMRESNKYMNPFYKMVTASWNLDLVAPDGVADTLKANGISLESISAAILGHVHCDHTGNLATFPKSVGLVVGPGSPASGENLATEIDVAPEVLEGRSFRELSREKDAWKDIGTFKGLDYFGDGSMWLLDTPGVRCIHHTDPSLLPQIY